MFSVTKTGMNFLPLWTANVWLMRSGVIVDRRDQVFITALLPAASAFLTFSSSLASMYGPFLTDLATF